MKYWLSLSIYRVIFFLLTPVILLLFVIRSKKNPQYRQRLLERLGFLSPTLQKNSLIIHAASVGETIAIKNLVNLLQQQYPNEIITITSFTPTGSAQVKKLFNNSVQHCYLPLDNIVSTTLFLRQLSPKALIFMETELWPNLIAQAAKQHIPMLLINARLSKHSCQQYQKINALISPTLLKFTKILPLSIEHKENFIALGAEANQCTVLGNLKYDINISNEIKNKLKNLKLQLHTSAPIWLVASSHQGDEEIILATFKKLKQQHPELLLLLVPRHPERFDNIAQQCISAGFSLTKRSENQPVDQHCDIWLLDTLGELSAAYGLATIVTMAGTFSNIGGHNPLEAALFKKPIVLGPDMANFKEVLSQLTQANACIQIPNTSNIDKQLANSLNLLLNDQHQQQILGENAYQVVLTNQGASQKTCDAIAKYCAIEK